MSVNILGFFLNINLHKKTNCFFWRVAHSLKNKFKFQRIHLRERPDLCCQPKMVQSLREMKFKKILLFLFLWTLTIGSLFFLESGLFVFFSFLWNPLWSACCFFSVYMEPGCWTQCSGMVSPFLYSILSTYWYVSHKKKIHTFSDISLGFSLIELGKVSKNFYLSIFIFKRHW